ncbi:hypothetical protein O6H91_18G015700 [Diphasiastrum complanatum]|uniref:Uncharacterized protein n=1 Tax=Diphasiastrum complanatum TaxID=34168 RepID=A0ACC2AYC1_DIPCM|nr:hypothetical protein O6H91_18G015700 [Diphasiastrum complanatum]
MSRNGCLLCAPLVAESVDEMLSQMRVAKKNGADVVELRVDYIQGFAPEMDLPRLIRGRVLPVIVTYRPKWEGGNFEGDEVFRVKALRKAISLGADFVDVELQVAAEFLECSTPERKDSSSRVVVSNHNYKMTPSLGEIGSLIARIQSIGADVVKIVTTAEKVTDVARVFHAVVHSQVPTIALVMGPKGLISRLLAPKFGGFLTFGALGVGQESAPGQPTLLQLTQMYRVDRMDRDTKVFGIVGNPVGHSKGPIIHNAAFQEIGVTIPFKEDALRCCDEVDPIAQAIGAVNTIIRRDGKLIGYNTDCEAAISAIEDALRGKKVDTRLKNR